MKWLFARYQLPEKKKRKHYLEKQSQVVKIQNSSTRKNASLGATDNNIGASGEEASETRNKSS
jgi:hypothetical protein